MKNKTENKFTHDEYLEFNNTQKGISATLNCLREMLNKSIITQVKQTSSTSMKPIIVYLKKELVKLENIETYMMFEHHFERGNWLVTERVYLFVSSKETGKPGKFM